MLRIYKRSPGFSRRTSFLYCGRLKSFPDCLSIYWFWGGTPFSKRAMRCRSSFWSVLETRIYPYTIRFTPFPMKAITEKRHTSEGNMPMDGKRTKPIRRGNIQWEPESSQVFLPGICGRIRQAYGCQGDTMFVFWRIGPISGIALPSEDVVAGCAWLWKRFPAIASGTFVVCPIRAILKIMERNESCSGEKCHMADLLYAQILIKKGRKREKTGGKPSVFPLQISMFYRRGPATDGLLWSRIFPPFHRPFGQAGFCLP